MVSAARGRFLNVEASEPGFEQNKTKTGGGFGLIRVNIPQLDHQNNHPK
jgi:hypothetical protein